jgi:hypothetical protein
MAISFVYVVKQEKPTNMGFSWVLGDKRTPLKYRQEI